MKNTFAQNILVSHWSQTCLMKIAFKEIKLVSHEHCYAIICTPVECNGR